MPQSRRAWLGGEKEEKGPIEKTQEGGRAVPVMQKGRHLEIWVILIFILGKKFRTISKNRVKERPSPSDPPEVRQQKGKGERTSTKECEGRKNYSHPGPEGITLPLLRRGIAPRSGLQGLTERCKSRGKVREKRKGGGIQQSATKLSRGGKACL